MLHTKELNNRINILYAKALRLTYQNRDFSFDKLLKLIEIYNIC